MPPPLDVPLARVSPLGRPEPWFRHLQWFSGLDHGAYNGLGTGSEYFVPFSAGPNAIKALLPLAAEIADATFTVLLRVVASDDAWMSTANGANLGGEPLLVIEFQWIGDKIAELSMLLARIESALGGFLPRPHWGMLFTMSPSAYLPLYQRLNDFKRIAHELDPRGKFRNSFLDEKIFAKI